MPRAKTTPIERVIKNLEDAKGPLGDIKAKDLGSLDIRVIRKRIDGLVKEIKAGSVASNPPEFCPDPGAHEPVFKPLEPASVAPISEAVEESNDLMF